MENSNTTTNANDAEFPQTGAAPNVDSPRPDGEQRTGAGGSTYGRRRRRTVSGPRARGAKKNVEYTGPGGRHHQFCDQPL